MSLFPHPIYDHVNFKLPSFPYWTLYILECENNYLYVGITRESVCHRYFLHKSRKGAESTIKHRPINILKIISTNEKSHSKMAINYENRCVRLCQVLVKNKKILGGHIKPSFYHKP
jgi:hypothetical protein